MSELASLDVAVSPIDKFQEFLTTKRKRLTQERSLIVEEVFSDHEHFDADQLVERLCTRHDGRRVSRATVYRTLRELEEAGLLRKVARAKHGDVYEHDYSYPEHDHLICRKCGSLIEFSNQAISKFLEKVATEHGFRMDGHRLEVHGLCEECSRQPRRRHGKLDFV